MVRDRLLGSVCLQESNQLPVCFLKLCQESVQLSETVLIDEPRFDVDTGIGKSPSMISSSVIPKPLGKPACAIIAPSFHQASSCLASAASA